jgi:hypothetical protein
LDAEPLSDFRNPLVTLLNVSGDCPMKALQPLLALPLRFFSLAALRFGILFLQ